MNSENNENTEYKKYFLNPGYIYVTDEPTIISTVLGSCISICIYDNIRKYGGMNHYLLARYNTNRQPSVLYGNIAIDQLVKTFLSFGSHLSNLTASITGGASREGNKMAREIADDNINIAVQQLKQFDIPIIKNDTGGHNGRKIHFYTDQNQIEVKTIVSNYCVECMGHQKTCKKKCIWKLNNKNEF